MTVILVRFKQQFLIFFVTVYERDPQSALSK